MDVMISRHSLLWRGFGLIERDERWPFSVDANTYCTHNFINTSYTIDRVFKSHSSFSQCNDRTLRPTSIFSLDGHSSLGHYNKILLSISAMVWFGHFADVARGVPNIGTSTHSFVMCAHVVCIIIGSLAAVRPRAKECDLKNSPTLPASSALIPLNPLTADPPTALVNR